MMRLQSAMVVEEPCEFRGSLSNETILSEAPLGERATIIHDSGVGCKLLASEAQGTSPEKSEGDDMIWTMQRCIDAGKAAGATVASWIEHQSTCRSCLRCFWPSLRSLAGKYDSNSNSGKHQRPGEHQSQWYSSMGSMRSTQLETIESKHRVNCGDLQNGQSAAKPGFGQERSTTIPKGSTAKRLEAHDTLSSQVEGDEMVCSVQECAAACNDAGSGVAYTSEHMVPTNCDRYFSNYPGWSWWWGLRSPWKRCCNRSDEQRKRSCVNIGTLVKKFMLQTSLTAGNSSNFIGQSAAKPSSDGRFNDQSNARTPKRVEKGSILASNVEDGDMVCTALNGKGVAVLDKRTGRGVANPTEHSGYVPKKSSSPSRQQYFLNSNGFRWSDSAFGCNYRRSSDHAWVKLTPPRTEMCVEKLREFRETLFETILSEAWSEDQERATTIPEVGVHSKLLAVEARSTLHQGNDIVSSAWRQVAAHDGAALSVATQGEEFDYKSVIEIA